MAELTRTPAADYRKHAFSQAGNHSSSWPTPPTETDNDFSQDMDKEKSVLMLPALKEEEQIALAAIPALHSPPASPVQGWAEKLPPIHSPKEDAVHTPLPPITDRQLFSEPGAESQTPLFSSQSPLEDRTDSLSPVGRQQSPLPKPVQTAPTTKPSFTSIYSIFPQFQGADREFFRKYRQTCYQEVKQIPAWRPINTARTPPLVTHTTVKHVPTAERPYRVTKPKDQLKLKPVAAKPKLPRVSTAASPVARSVKTTALSKRDRQSVSVEPQARKRAPPSKPVVQDNWQEISDYSPPTESLDSMALRLRVHWKGVPNDLSNDPEIRHLHPQEVEIAQELKLPANQYLANKRRIFEARLKSIREHKNFTKTAAQQACNIDVNKTSQLYEAYEKVGWFDESNFKQWLV